MPPVTSAQLMIPCLVEDCLPQIGEAVVAVLEHLGVAPTLPGGQTCCGQPAYKCGDWDTARALALRALDIFSGPSAQGAPVVCPSGSCVKMVRSYPELFVPGTPDHARALALAARTFEFCEFVTDVLGREDLGAQYAGKACFHASCQIEQLGQAGHSGQGPTPALRLLAQVRGLEVVQPERADRCCGFGGQFAVQFASLSASLVQDKAREILDTGAALVVSAEPSCLMNIGGHLARLALPNGPLPALHVAQVLAQGLPNGLPNGLPGGLVKGRAAS